MLLCTAAAPGARAGDITASQGALGLGTLINGGLGCTAGSCLVTGGTGAGSNLFHRFASFEANGAITGVTFQNGVFSNVVVGVQSPTLIDRPVGLDTPGSLVWLSPSGITLGGGAQFPNVTNLTLSTATGLQVGAGVFDAFSTTAAQAALLSGTPVPGLAGLVNDPASLAGLGLLQNGDLSINGGLLTVDQELLLDARGGNVLLAAAQEIAARTIGVNGKDITLRSDLRSNDANGGVQLDAAGLIRVDKPLVSVFSEGTQIYQGNLAIGTGNLLSLKTGTSPAGGIGFFGTVDGPGSLDVNLVSSQSRVVFNRDVGSTTPLASLRVGSPTNNAGRTFINANITTIGNQIYFNNASAGIKGVGVFTNSGFDAVPFNFSGESTAGLESANPAVPPRKIPGWDIDLRPIVFGKTAAANASSGSLIDGKRVPVDSRNIFDISSGANSGTSQGSEFSTPPCFDNCGSSSTRTLSASSSNDVSDNSPGNTQSLLLNTGSLYPCDASRCIINGPSIQSQGTVFLEPGDIVSFRWTANGLEDDYNVNAFLLEQITGKAISLLNSTGGSVVQAWRDSGSRSIASVISQYNNSADRIGTWSTDNTNPGWITSSVTVGAGESPGNYKFVYTTGSYDGTGGQAVGASMGVDSITVSSLQSLDLFSNAPLPGSVTLNTLGAGSSIDITGNLENGTALNLLSKNAVVIGSLGGSGTLASVPQAVILNQITPPQPTPTPSPSPGFVPVANPVTYELFSQVNQPVLPPSATQPSMALPVPGLETATTKTQLVDNLRSTDLALATSKPTDRPAATSPTSGPPLIAAIIPLPIGFAQSKLRNAEATRADEVRAKLPNVEGPACATKDLSTAALQSQLKEAQSGIRRRASGQFRAYQPAILSLSFSEDRASGAADAAPGSFLDITLITSTGDPVSQRVQLSLPRFRSLLQEFYGQISSRDPIDPGNPESPVRQLHRVLIEPIEAELKTRGVNSLVITTDRGLHSVPFAALHDGQSSFGQRYSFSLTPSLSLTCIDQPKPRADAGRLLAAGATNFQGLSPLPLVQQEINGLAAQRPADAFLDQRFTPSLLLRQISDPRYDRMHIATHAEFLPGGPKQSKIHTGSGTVSFAEFAGMRDRRSGEPLDLFTLSACRTAVGDSTSEFGFAGLALQAGSRSAMGTLWYVDDAAISAAFQQLYRYLDQGYPKAEALRAVRDDLISNRIRLDGNRVVAADGATLLDNLTVAQQQRISGGLNHPYFWAGISLLGSPW
ncbi:MAG: CHAT domain-containing protein [Synechococcaceae cyanobacterium]|nr:CHAT domain-containing protein [Synechococcaceae cyanobacterium]